MIAEVVELDRAVEGQRIRHCGAWAVVLTVGPRDRRAFVPGSRLLTAELCAADLVGPRVQITRELWEDRDGDPWARLAEVSARFVGQVERGLR